MNDKQANEEEMARLKRELPPEVYKILVATLEISQGNYDTCPHCGAKTKPLQQVGRSVYGSCGCRLYQGFIPRNN